MKRSGVLGGLAALLLLLPVMAHAQAQTGGGFDVERATRAYLDLLAGPARAKSDAYFEGGYWLPLWSTLLSTLLYWILLASGA